jgi:hypothetical protein
LWEVKHEFYSTFYSTRVSTHRKVLVLTRTAFFAAAVVAFYWQRVRETGLSVLETRGAR